MPNTTVIQTSLVLVIFSETAQTWLYLAISRCKPFSWEWPEAAFNLLALRRENPGQRQHPHTHTQWTRKRTCKWLAAGRKAQSDDWPQARPSALCDLEQTPSLHFLSCQITDTRRAFVKKIKQSLSIYDGGSIMVKYRAEVKDFSKTGCWCSRGRRKIGPFSHSVPYIFF